MSLRVQRWKKHSATLDRSDGPSDYRTAGPFNLIPHFSNKYDQPDPNRRRPHALHMSVKAALSLLLTHIIDSLAAYALSMHPIPDWAEPDAGYSGQRANKSPVPSAGHQSFEPSETNGTTQDGDARDRAVADKIPQCDRQMSPSSDRHL
jgi:hypothetical protein